MSGPVTYSHEPFASTVTVGDNNSAPGGNGVIPQSAVATLASSTVNAKIFGNDDIDDGTPAGAARADAYRKAQVEAGVFKQSDLDKGDNATASEVDSRPPPTISGTQVDCTQIHSGFNLATHITPSTTLKQFIYDLPQIPNHKYRAIPAQMNLQPDDIVCNLAQLCANVWEPIKAHYPNAIITNALRTGDSIGAGCHGTGQGMDIQFTGVQPAGYYAIAQWIKDNIAASQVILEYSTSSGATKAWIHCSVAPSAPGKGIVIASNNRVLTMMNHRLRNVGLANLAV